MGAAGKVKLKSPYPWFGGKSRAAEEVWRRFGDVPNYVEPFFGSGAVLLARPTTPRIETVNDLNAWLTNFWRAVKADPDAVAAWAADPVSELDLHARGDWLFYREGVDAEFVERLRSDPDWYDVRSAGWWVWGQCSWIGDNWGRRGNARRDDDGNVVGVCHTRPLLIKSGAGVNRQLPHVGKAGRGVNRQRPHVGDAGRGVNRQLPHPSTRTGVDCNLPTADEGELDGGGTAREGGIRAYLRQLAERFARVRICCGDWTRVLGPTPTTKLGLTGVFLDPPYGVADRASCYGEDDSRSVAADVRAWCIEHGGDRKLRIALCGYEGEHDELQAAGWVMHAWKARGGYGSQAAGGNDNPRRERIWFSPACLGGEKLPLFEGARDR